MDGEDVNDIGIFGFEGIIFDDVISFYVGFREDWIINFVFVFIGKFGRYCKSYGDNMVYWFVDRFDLVDGEFYLFFFCVFLLYFCFLE